MKWIETDLGVRCLLAEGLGKGSDRDPWWGALILVVRSFPRSSKNSSRLFALFPSACVDDLARLVIGDKREVVVTFAITDLIDPENEEIPKAVGIELLAQRFVHRSSLGVRQATLSSLVMRGLVHLCRCPSYQVFEVPREARLINWPGKGYRLK